MNEAVGNFFWRTSSESIGILRSLWCDYFPPYYSGSSILGGSVIWAPVLERVWVQPRSLEVATLRSELTLGPEIHIPVLEMSLKI